MNTTMKKMTLGAALVAALSATAPARADDAGLYLPAEYLSVQVRKEIKQDLNRQNVELGEIIRQEIRAAAAAAAATADAREQSELPNRDGAFWM
jgi:hypothetical protein